ncbi:hypothetical protein BU25DRAFT_349156 [Macroventuria anomochaeta]|uniref:Uncharacterized protein n=1 Tax=Macroventuria anomochaeta TaxID=301207 RepID=A0ACB6RRC3_9PLEO|nr:uncharacterized protein BU25DRAFT_349156 [Macroventuria anomochaeta]KAF2623817.1 hypothetical protein BU25DRAFT_349156 [Macroventuria anomochaeta]
MGRNPAPRQETNTDRSVRARDNKRRHRARQKEYVLELERKVAMTREQGVQATKEVQSAAQRVVRENARLRDLLRRMGYTDRTIDAWVAEDQCSSGTEPIQLGVKLPSGHNAQDVASTFASQKIETPDLPTNLGVLPTQTSTVTCKRSPRQPQRVDQPGAPCKLITMLAENPALDITQVSLSVQSEDQPCETNVSQNYGSNGIECSTAYRMLIQHATSGEKMDRIAAALESGCMPSATGGCRVKESVVWRTLDQECT